MFQYTVFVNLTAFQAYFQIDIFLSSLTTINECIVNLCNKTYTNNEIY